jgi:AcrR family transcriptional regulator
MSIIERKDREKAEMRKLILDAAMELLIDEGYANVSIRKIAAKIEYSPGSIYTYFKDKDSIYYALHNEGFAILYQKQLSAQGISDPRDRLIAHGRAYIDFALNNQQYYDIMFIMRNPEDIIAKLENWDNGHRSYELLKRNVIECKAAGFFKDQDPNSIAFLLWSVVHGIASLMIRRRTIMKEMKDIDQSSFVENTLSTLDSLIR